MKKQVFKFKKDIINENSIKYHFYLKDKFLRYEEFLDNLIKEDKNFLQTFLKSLEDANCELRNYFWECVPVSQQTLNKRFEFVATKSKKLETNEKEKENEFKSFKEHLKNQNNFEAISFLNLGKDAILIVPSPKRMNRNIIEYKNISQFVKNSNDFPEQQVMFWKEVALQFDWYLRRLKENKSLWLSTDGLGVNYLHVRIDLSPKYYSWKNYLSEEKIIESESENWKREREEINDSFDAPKKMKLFGSNCSFLLPLIVLFSFLISYFFK